MFKEFLFSNALTFGPLILYWLLLLIPGNYLLIKAKLNKNTDMLFFSLTFITTSLQAPFWIYRNYQLWLADGGQMVVSDLSTYYAERWAVLLRILSFFFLTIYCARMTENRYHPYSMLLIGLYVFQILIRVTCDFTTFCTYDPIHGNTNNRRFLGLYPGVINFEIPMLSFIMTYLLFFYIYVSLEVPQESNLLKTIHGYWVTIAFLLIIGTVFSFFNIPLIYGGHYIALGGAFIATYMTIRYPESFYLTKSQYWRGLKSHGILDKSDILSSDKSSEGENTSNNMEKPYQNHSTKIGVNDPSSHHHEYDINNLMEILSYKKLFHPVKIAILQILVRDHEISSSELRKKLEISWGSFTNHINGLKDAGYIGSRKGFDINNVTTYVFIEHEGRTEYLKMSTILTNILKKNKLIN